MKGPRPRHIPMRTCVACRQERPKRELVRVVCGPAGEIKVDPTGKAPGRGAYLCPQPICWENALKRRVLDQALKTSLSAEDYARLRSCAPSVAQSGPPGQQA